jgi:hypothetical protein
VTYLRKKSLSRSIFRRSHTCREGKTVRHLGRSFPNAWIRGWQCDSAKALATTGVAKGLGNAWRFQSQELMLEGLGTISRIQRGDLLHLEVTLPRSCRSEYCLVGRLRTPLQLCIHAVTTASAKSSRSNPSSTRQLELPISSSNRYRTRQHMCSNGF